MGMNIRYDKEDVRKALRNAAPGFKVREIARASGVSEGKLHALKSRGYMGEEDMDKLVDWLIDNDLLAEPKTERAPGIEESIQEKSPVGQVGTLLHNLSVMIRSKELPPSARVDLLEANLEAISALVPVLRKWSQAPHNQND